MKFILCIGSSLYPEHKPLLLLLSYQVVSDCLRPQWMTASHVSLSFTFSLSLLKLMCIELVMPSDLLILTPPSPHAISLSQQGLFQWVGSQSIRASASASVLQCIFRLISFRNDWFDLLVVHGTLKSLLQHHSSKASVLWHSPSFLSHPYMTTGKTEALTRRTFVGLVLAET